MAMRRHPMNMGTATATARRGAGLRRGMLRRTHHGKRGYTLDLAIVTRPQAGAPS